MNLSPSIRATRDEKQNHRINCEALHLLSRSVSLVLRNNDGEGANERHLQAWKELNQNSSAADSGLLVQPTAEWRQSTWEKLGMVVNKLGQSAAASNHPHWKVRCQTLKLVQTLIVDCRREDYEKSCSDALVEIAVSRLDDEKVEVKELAEKVVEQLRKMGEGGGTGSRSLRESVSAALLQATRNLTKIFGCVNDAEKVKAMRAVKGYLTVLGVEGVKMALLSPSGSINKLLFAFMQVLEMDVDDLRIIQRLPSNTLNTMNEGAEEFMPQLRFQQFSDEQIRLLIKECLRILGGNCEDSLYALTDSLIEYLEARNGDVDGEDGGNHGGGYAKQVIFMLNEIIVGAALAEHSTGKAKNKKMGSTGVGKFIKDALLPLYLSDGLMQVQCEVVDGSKELETKKKSINSKFLMDSRPSRLVEELNSGVVSSTISKMVPRFNSNILLVVLTLEGVSFCAEATSTDFRPLLLRALYPVMEKVAAEITMIQDAAYSALKRMAVGCGYSSVGGLLLGNSDYVINQLRSELRHGFILSGSKSASSDAPRVLAAMLKNAGPELLPLLRDTVDEVLLCLDTTVAYEPDRAKVFLKVLSALVFYVNQWFRPARDELKEVKKSYIDAEYSPDFLKEYWKNQEIAESLTVDDDLDDEAGDYAQPDEEYPTSEDPPLPYHVRVVEQIMLRCKYYMPDEDPRIRVLVLDVMRHCCEALAPHENTLLPLAHQCWSSFTCRLRDIDRHVTLKAFEVLLALSRTCGDFLLQRFTKEVLPAITTFMTSQGEVSAGLVKKARPFTGFLLNQAEDEREKRRRKRDDWATSGAAYKFTVAYKLQLAVLKGIGPLCQTIKARVETGLDQVVDFLLLHLRLSQPIELQDAAKEALIALGTVDADLLWLRVATARGDLKGGKSSLPSDLSPSSLGDHSHDILTEILSTF